MKIILWLSTLLQELFSTLADLCFHLFGGIFILSADRGVGLELRLGTGGTHHDGAVVFQQELEHIGLGQAIQTRRIVHQFDNLLATELLDTATECLHDALHLGKTGAAVELVAVQGVQAVAIGLVQLLQLVQQADALSGIPRHEISGAFAGVPVRTLRADHLG